MAKVSASLEPVHARRSRVRNAARGEIDRVQAARRRPKGNPECHGCAYKSGSNDGDERSGFDSGQVNAALPMVIFHFHG